MLNGQNLNGSWRVVLTDDVEKQLRRLPGPVRRKIISVVDGMTKSPFSGDVRSLKGGDTLWRRRVGSYRVIFEIYPAERVVFIYDILRRTSSTY